MQNFELLLKVLACACAHVPRQQEDTIRSEDPSLWYDIVFLGATDVVNAADKDAVGEVLEMTGGGVDYAFECIGLQPTIKQAVGMAAKGGAAVLVGVLPTDQEVPINASDVTLQEKRILGSFMGSNAFRRDMPQYVDYYLGGRLRLDEMISKSIALEEINDAFDAMRAGEVARSVIVYE